jgi:hypothetical protein
MMEWRKLCSSARDVEVDGDSLVVSLQDGRRHRIDVQVSDEAVELRAIVAGRAVVESQEDAALAAWYKNRAISLVGFRIDRKGRLIGETWIPQAGLTAAEFLVYVHSMAAACDLFEFQLTGQDKE